MNVAVVGDVHGHLELMYAILGRWQMESGRHIDLILQVGDLGAFVAESTLDSATRKHAARDPEELGFAPFAEESPPSTPLDPRPPLVFIPGNHEDFSYLERCDRAAPAHHAMYSVAVDGRILALRSSQILEYAVGADSIRIAGVSGVTGRRRKPGVHDRVHLNEDEVRALARRGRGRVQILLTHEAPAGLDDRMRHGAGSPLLRLLVEKLQPALAFFGHHGRSGEFAIGGSRVFALADCGYHRGRWTVACGAIVIVGWENGCRDVRYVEEDWLQQATATSWRHWAQRPL